MISPLPVLIGSNAVKVYCGPNDAIGKCRDFNLITTTDVLATIHNDVMIQTGVKSVITPTSTGDEMIKEMNNAIFDSNIYNSPTGNFDITLVDSDKGEYSDHLINTFCNGDGKVLCKQHRLKFTLHSGQAIAPIFPQFSRVYNRCSYPQFSQYKVEKTIFIDVLVPPQEILYVIYKSHIHRIVPHTGIQHKDIDIWMEGMRKYTFLRNRLKYYRTYSKDKVVDGWAALDDIMYEPDLGKLSYVNEISTDALQNKLNHYMLRINYHRFKETNFRIGDTILDVDKTPDEFFADTVPRVIEYDELHKVVVLDYRDTKELLFTKFQVDGNFNAGLDTLFNHPHWLSKWDPETRPVVIQIIDK